MKVRNPMRKSSVCFLHFLHPSLTLDCFLWLEGKSFPNPLNLKYHQMEQKESGTCPRSIPRLEYFRCSSSRALGTGKVRVARCPCCLWRDGSESVSCLGRCRELSGRAEVIPQCDDVGTLVAILAHRLSVLCPYLPVSMPWGTILVAGWTQFPTNSTEDQNTWGAGWGCLLKPEKPDIDLIYSTTPQAVVCRWLTSPISAQCAE